MNSHRTPTIFLSSVIRGGDASQPALGPYREDISNMVVNHFGWECFCSGVDDGAFWGGPLSACIRGVERCDLFLAILWHQSGSIIDYHGISVTEHEIYTALNLEKAIRLYVVNAEERDPALEALIDVLSADIELGLYLRRCSITGLLDTIAQDLNSFGRHWSSGTQARMTRPLYLRKYLKSLVISTSVFPMPSFAQRRAIWDLTKLTQLLCDMDILHAVQDHVGILIAGSRAMPILQARSPLYFPTVRPLWIHFLERWYGACNWLGRLEGAFGSLAAARAAMEIARLSGDFANFHEWAAILGSSLYTLGTLISANEALPGKLPNGSRRRKESDAILRTALAYNSLSYYRRATPDTNLLSSRASLLFSIKHDDAALQLFQTCLRRATTSSEYARTLGMIGRIFLRKGQTKTADQFLESSVQHSFTDDPGAKVRSHRSYAEALISQGRFSEGLERLYAVLNDANHYGFIHQARVCEGSIARAMSTRHRGGSDTKFAPRSSPH